MENLTLSQMLAWEWWALEAQWCIAEDLCHSAWAEIHSCLKTAPVLGSAFFSFYNPVLRAFQTRSQGTVSPPVCVINMPECINRTANESSLHYGNNTRSTHCIQHERLLSCEWDHIKWIGCVAYKLKRDRDAPLQQAHLAFLRITGVTLAKCFPLNTERRMHPHRSSGYVHTT